MSSNDEKKPEKTYPVPIQKLPYMGERKEDRIPPPAPRSRTNREFYRDETSDKYAKGGKVGSASKRGDGIAQRGKTKGRMV